MKERYRLFLRRKSVYYAFDNTTKKFESLRTKDKTEAERLLLAMNEAGKQPAMNLGLARVYLKHSDPLVSKRTWQFVLDEIIKLKSGPTQYRWQSAAKDKAFDLIRNRLLIETQPEHFLEVLRKGTKRCQGRVPRDRFRQARLCHLASGNGLERHALRRANERFCDAAR